MHIFGAIPQRVKFVIEPVYFLRHAGSTALNILRERVFVMLRGLKRLSRSSSRSRNVNRHLQLCQRRQYDNDICQNNYDDEFTALLLRQ